MVFPRAHAAAACQHAERDDDPGDRRLGEPLLERGLPDSPLLAQLLMGSLPGIWLGSRLVSRTPERLIRSILSVLLAWAGAKLVLV